MNTRPAKSTLLTKIPPRLLIPLEIALFIALTGGAAYLWTAPLRAEGELQKASLNALIAASKKDKDNPRVFYYLGVRLRQMGHLGPAKAAFERTISLDPTNEETWLALSSTSAAFGSEEEAFGTLIAYLKQNPRSVRANLALGLLYQQRNAQKSAYESAQKVIELDPKNVAGWRLAGSMALALNQKVEAEKAFRQAVTIDPGSWENYLFLARVYTAEAKYDDALTQLTLAVKYGPDEPRVLSALGRAQLQVAKSDGDVEQAAKNLQKAIEKDGNNADAHIGLAEADLRLKRPEDAETHLAIAETLKPQDPEVAIRRKQAAEMRGDKIAAAAFGKEHEQRIADNTERLRLQSEVWQYPKDMKRRLDLARFYAVHGPYAGAIDAYNRVLAANPDAATKTAVQNELEKLRMTNPEAFGAGSLQLPMPSEAENAVASPENLLKDAAAMVEHNRLPEAIKAYQAIISHLPRSAAAYEGLGIIYEKQGETEKAFQAFRQATTLEPDRPVSGFYLAGLYFKAGFPDHASKLMEKVVAVAPNDHTYWHALGLAYTNIETTASDEKAATVFLKAATLDPTNPSYWRDLANVESKVKRYKEAEQHYRQALQLNLGDPVSQQLLGSFLAENNPTPDNLKEAQKLLSQSLQTVATNPDTLFGLGLVAEKQGDIKGATQYMEQAVSLRNTMTSVWYRLGRLYSKLGNTERAKECQSHFQELTDYARQYSRIEGLARIHLKDPALRLQLARIYLRGGHYAKAINQYQMCLKLDPKNTAVQKERDTVVADLTRRGQMPRMEEFNGMLLAGIDQKSASENPSPSPTKAR